MGTSLGFVKYGIGPVAVAPPAPAGAGVNNGAVTSDGIGALHPDHPMLWLLAIGAATLGLISVSTSARVGPLRASASV